MLLRGPEREGSGAGPGATARPQVEAGDPLGAGEPVASSEELDGFLCLWDIAEGIEQGDPAEVARSAHFRAQFCERVKQGGRARESAVHDLLRGLLDWLEEPPHQSVEELMALARQEATWDLSDALAQAIDRENLRLRWIPRLQAALTGDG